MTDFRIQVPAPGYLDVLKADKAREAETAKLRQSYFEMKGENDRLRTAVDIMRGEIRERDEKIRELTEDINKLYAK